MPYERYSLPYSAEWTHPVRWQILVNSGGPAFFIQFCSFLTNFCLFWVKYFITKCLGAFIQASTFIWHYMVYPIQSDLQIFHSAIGLVKSQCKSQLQFPLLSTSIQQLKRRLTWETSTSANCVYLWEVFHLKGCHPTGYITVYSWTSLSRPVLEVGKVIRVGWWCPTIGSLSHKFDLTVEFVLKANCIVPTSCQR